MKRVVVVGAGLFGSMMAKAAQQAGCEVMLVDPRLHNTGSSAAACLLKPSWAAGLMMFQFDAGLEWLQDTYGVQEIKMSTGVWTPSINIFHIHPAEIMGAVSQLVIPETVMDVGDGWVDTTAGRFEADLVIVSAGAWSGAIMKDRMPVVYSKVGVSLLYDQTVDPQLSVWAPYKQAIAFERVDGTWFGDGTAIIAKNWTEKYEERAVKHADSYFQLKRDNLIGAAIGHRPYVTGYERSGYFHNVSDKLLVATGGGKNGSIMGAYYATLVKRMLS